MSGTSDPKALARRRREAWTRFMGFLDRHDDENWLFRGHGRTGWTLTPKIGRSTAARWTASAEKQVFRLFRRHAHGIADMRGLSDWDILALAQHHGLPTRLLDWTTNPLIAAFFAVSAAHDGADAEIFAAPRSAAPPVPVESLADPFNLSGVALLAPPVLVQRIAAQRGVFTAHGAPAEPWSPGDDGSPGLERYMIDGEHRSYFRQRLFALGVDSASVMGGLDGLCATLDWRYGLGFSSGSVYL